MTRAPRDPAKLAASKARRDAADASVQMLTPKTGIDYQYHEGDIHVVVKATTYTYPFPAPNGEQTFVMETQNTLSGVMDLMAVNCRDEESMLERARALQFAFQQDVYNHLHKVFSYAQR